MKSSFIFYLLGIADVDILFYNLGQTYTSLTCTKIDTPYILERREYKLILWPLSVAGTHASNSN